jgi:hypothetical protein
MKENDFSRAVLGLMNIINIFEKNKNEINIFNVDFNQALV